MDQYVVGLLYKGASWSTRESAHPGSRVPLRGTRGARSHTVWAAHYGTDN